MDGGGRCQQSRVGTDRDCSCPFCTDGRLESKLGECSRCASGSNRDPSTSPATSSSSSSQRNGGANSVPAMDNSPSGAGDRSLRGQVFDRNSELG